MRVLVFYLLGQTCELATIWPCSLRPFRNHISYFYFYSKLEKGKNNNIRVGLSNMAKLDKMSSLYFCSVVTGPNASSDINMSLNPIPL